MKGLENDYIISYNIEYNNTGSSTHSGIDWADFTESVAVSSSCLEFAVDKGRKQIEKKYQNEKEMSIDFIDARKL